jgi:hypothetical protein
MRYASFPRAPSSKRIPEFRSILKEERMRTKTTLTLSLAMLLHVSAPDSVLQASLSADLDVVSANDAHMAIVKHKDVSGQVFKRLGLPNQDYCWQQCLQEERCTGTRWGVIDGATAGQCQLLSGELVFGEPRDIKTEDGQRILVTASRKEAGASN